MSHRQARVGDDNVIEENLDEHVLGRVLVVAVGQGVHQRFAECDLRIFGQLDSLEADDAGSAARVGVDEVDDGVDCGRDVGADGFSEDGLVLV